MKRKRISACTTADCGLVEKRCEAVIFFVLGSKCVVDFEPVAVRPPQYSDRIQPLIKAKYSRSQILGRVCAGVGAPAA